MVHNAGSRWSSFVEIAADRLPSTEDYEGEQIAEDDRATIDTTARWVRRFLMCPNAALGRNGEVCPYTRPSVQSGLFHIAVGHVAAGLEAYDEVTEVMRGACDFWESLPPIVGNQALLKTVLVVFPGLCDATDVLDRVQRQLSREITQRGLMIGEFYPGCEIVGLHNPDFFPMRSPIPLLALRRMVLGDLAFLWGDDVKIDAYLRIFGDQALRMIDAARRRSDIAPAVATRLRDRVAASQR